MYQRSGFLRTVALSLAILVVVCAATTLRAQHVEGCGACHVPHWAIDTSADPDAYGIPLLNPAAVSTPLPTYDLYSSTSFDLLATDIGQPDGASKLCLGCHDGANPAVGESTAIFLAADLAKSHPVSFTYSSALAGKIADGSLRDPNVALSGLTAAGTIAEDMLSGGKIQCHTCHDIHMQGFGDASLRFSSVATLCKTCHDK